MIDANGDHKITAEDLPQFFSDLDSDADKNITAAEWNNKTATMFDKVCRDSALLDRRRWLLKSKIDIESNPTLFSLIDTN